MCAAANENTSRMSVAAGAKARLLLPGFTLPLDARDASDSHIQFVVAAA